MENRTLIKSATVLSLDAQIGNSADYDVLIEGGKILEIGRDIYADKAEVIDASGMIVMPGFVDTHRHMWLGFLRNAGTGFLLSQGDFFEERQRRLAAACRPQDIRAAVLSSALGALDAGITTILNFANVYDSREQLEADVAALGEAGIRSVLAVRPPEGGLEAARLLGGELTTLALASGDPHTTPQEQIRAEWEQARQLGMRITVQVGMGGDGKHDQLAELYKAKLLGPDVLYAHGNTLTDRDLHTIRDTSRAVASAPAAEMTMGYGRPTIQRVLDAGIRPSLGVDSELTNRGDLFTQMRSMISMQHAMRFEKKLAGSLFPDRMIATRDVIEFATAQGAEALGMEEQIGTLAPGKQADIVLMRQDHINVMPVNDPIGAVVWAMDTSNVDTVMVAGKVLKRGGQLVNLDLARLRQLTAEARQHVLGAVPA